MPTYDEDAVGEAWIVSRLRPDSVLSALLGTNTLQPPVPNIFRRTADGSAQPPWLLFEKVSARDIQSDNRTQIYQEQLWALEIVTAGVDTATAGQIAYRLFLALHKQAGAILNGAVIDGWRSGGYA